MVWTFIILGLLTSAWSLYALIAAFVTKRGSLASHAAAIALLATAWTLGHQTGIGRLALVAAIVVECVARFRRDKSTEGETLSDDTPFDEEDSQSSDDEETSNDGDTSDSTDTEEEVEPPPPPEPPPVIEPRPLSSCVLLPTAWAVAPSVFHASLRRGGQRNAVLLEDESDDDLLVVRVGDIRVEIQSIAEPDLRAQVNAAARLAWEWPEASDAVRTYAAHVAFTTIAPEETPPRDLVHLHHRVQAALAEFTNAIAVFWPDAGRLMSPAGLADLIASPNDAAAMSASCVSFRVFEPQAEGEPYVLDTAGLHALGLPDLQAFSWSEPDDTTSAMLYELAERLFRQRDAIQPDVAIRASDDRLWQVDLAWSNREPRRAVLSLWCEDATSEKLEETTTEESPAQQTEPLEDSEPTQPDHMIEAPYADVEQADESSYEESQPQNTAGENEEHAGSLAQDEDLPRNIDSDQDDPTAPPSPPTS